MRPEDLKEQELNEEQLDEATGGQDHDTKIITE
jgi:hypothetical protein